MDASLQFHVSDCFHGQAFGIGTDHLRQAGERRIRSDAAEGSSLDVVVDDARLNRVLHRRGIWINRRGERIEEGSGQHLLPVLEEVEGVAGIKAQ